MAKFEETMAKTKEYFGIARKKTEEFVDLQKLKINAATIRNGIDKDFETIGRMYYEGHKNGADNSDAIRAVVADVDGKYDELADIEEKIREVNGGNYCTECGTQNSDDSAFCKKCGKQL